MSAPTKGRIVDCADGCGRVGPNNGRGLVRACWDRHDRAGTLEDYPVRRGSLPPLVQDALELRRRYGRPSPIQVVGEPAPDGITWQRVAEELGVPFARLDKARERAGWPDVGTTR